MTEQQAASLAAFDLLVAHPDVVLDELLVLMNTYTRNANPSREEIIVTIHRAVNR